MARYRFSKRAKTGSSVLFVLFLLCVVVLKCNGDPAQGIEYAYDRLNRICSVIYTDVLFATNRFDYSYLGPTLLVAGYANAVGLAVSQTFERNRNLITTVSNTWNGIPVAAFTYENNQIGQRISRNDYSAAGLLATNIFKYNARRELISATMGGNNYVYKYDAIGNRKSVVINTATNLFLANNLNQYTQVADITLSYNADWESGG